MKKWLKIIGVVFLLTAVASPCFAESPPFQIIYRQDSIVAGEVSTKSNLLLTVINRSGTAANDVVVSAMNTNPYYVINAPIPFGNIPDGQQKELLVPADVPNLFISEENEEVVWQLEHSTGGGEATTIEIVGDKG